MKNEYKYSFYSPGKYSPTRLEFITDDCLDNRKGFISLYKIDYNTAEAIKSTGTTKEFKGVCWSERLWIDIDSGEAADRAEETLIKMGLDYVAYFSGRKGAHFGILREHEPSHLLPLKDKMWVMNNFPEADLSLYNAMHLFRLPGTVHEDTGIEKSLVSQSKTTRALKLLELEEVKSGNIVSNSPMLPSNNSNSIFDSYRFMCQIKKVRNGNRHSTLVNACYALRDDVKIGLDAANFLVKELNKHFLEPKSEEEVEKIVRSIF